MHLIAAAVGRAQPCGPPCHHYSASTPLPDNASLFIAVPNYPPERLPIDTLDRSVRLIRRVRAANGCVVTLVADALDERPKHEWSALLNATHLWSVATAEAYLETRALVSKRDAKHLWAGTITVSGATVPGFQLWETSNAGDDVRDFIPVSCTDARLLAVLPPALAIGAILNSRNELELRVCDECTTATSYLCNGWVEAGCSLLFQIGITRFIARARSITPFIADVAPIRELPSQLVEALDMCAFRREQLGVVGRSYLCYPHPDIAKRLPRLEVRDGVLKPMENVGNQPWINPEQFEYAVRRLAARADPQKPGLRPPPHRTEVSRLERDILKRRCAQRKRPRQTSPLAENTAPRVLKRESSDTIQDVSSAAQQHLPEWPLAEDRGAAVSDGRIADINLDGTDATRPQNPGVPLAEEPAMAKGRSCDVNLNANSTAQPEQHEVPIPEDQVDKKDCASIPPVSDLTRPGELDVPLPANSITQPPKESCEYIQHEDGIAPPQQSDAQVPEKPVSHSTNEKSRDTSPDVGGTTLSTKPDVPSDSNMSLPLTKRNNCEKKEDTDTTGVDTETQKTTSPTKILAIGLAGSEPCGPSCYHHDSATPIPSDASLFISIPNISLESISTDILEETVKQIKRIRALDNCKATLVADTLDDRPKQEWGAILSATAVWSRKTTESYLVTRALVTPIDEAAKPVWAGKIAVSGAKVPGFRLVKSSSAGDDVHTLLPSKSTDARLLAVLPPALAIGGILNSRNELLLQVEPDCTTATSYLCHGWAECGSSFLVQIGTSRFIARARSGIAPFVADVSPVRDLTDEMTKALDMCSFRRHTLGVAARSTPRHPHSAFTTRLPILEIKGGRLKPVQANTKDPWIDEKEFEKALARLAPFADSKEPGLRPPMHHSEAAMLERTVLKRRYAQRKRPRQPNLPVGTGESTGPRALTKEKYGESSEGAGGTTAVRTARTQSVKAINLTNQPQPMLRRSLSQTPGSGTPWTARGTPGTRNLNGSISMRGIMTTRSAPLSDELLRTGSDAGVGGKSVAAMKMDRKARLQRQLAARTAQRTTARKSMELERTKSLRRKCPDSSYRRALESCHQFINCEVAARIRVEDVEFSALPRDKDTCFVTHGVEFAQIVRDRRDEVLQRYEKEVGRTEQEHASAWNTLGRRSVLEKIDSAVAKLTTPVGDVFRYLADKPRRRTSMPILSRRPSSSKSTTGSTSTKSGHPPSVVSADRWRSEVACRQTRRSLELAREEKATRRSEMRRRSSLS